MRFLRKYAVITRVSLSNAVAYRASVLSGFVFYTLYIYIFMRLWNAIYQEGSVHGYTLIQIVWYLIMTELISFGCRTDIYATMNDDVKSGSIAYMIGRPTHYVLYQFANALGQLVLNLCCFGALAVVLGLFMAGPLPTFHPRILPPLLVSVGLGIVIQFFFSMLIGMTAFVLEDNYSIFLIYQKLVFMLGTLLPVEFLPLWLQTVAKNLPFSYIAWAPAKLFVDYSPALFRQLLPRQLLWACTTLAVTLLFYRICVRRLQVNGG